MGTATIKIANIIEDGRLAGPQIRIAEVSRILSTGRIRTDEGSELENTVILPKYHNSQFIIRLEEFGVPYVTVPLHRLSKEKKSFLAYVFFFPFEIIKLVSLFKKRRFDVIHVSGGAWQIKGVIAGKLAGVKVLWHLNDTKTPGFIKKIFSVLSGWGASGFIVAGERVRKVYLENSARAEGKPVFEIPAPVNCSIFDPSKVEKAELEDHGIKIVTVGNINPFKGVEYFIQMAEILNHKHDDLQFYIIGPHLDSQKKYIQDLKELANRLELKNLVFYGPSLEIPKILKAADIYVCSSTHEASPTSVWEAMAMEKPIVATDVGDIFRYITNEVNGYVVSPEDPSQLADHVELLLENRKNWEKFGKRSREIVKEALDVSIIAGKHADAYSSVMNNEI